MSHVLRLSSILVLVATASACFAQQVLTPQSINDLQMNITASERRIGFFSMHENQSAVLVLGAGARRFTDAKLRLSLSNSGGSSFNGLDSYKGQAAAAGGGWVFLPGQGSPAPSGRLLDTRSGQWASFPIIPEVTFATISGDRLALLGLERSGSAILSRIAVYDCRTRALLGSAQHPAFPGFIFLSFSKPDTILLIETATLQVQPYNVADGSLTALPPLKLSGAEVEDSLKRMNGSNLPVGSRPRYVTAHFPGTDGNQFFFLAPHKAAEGLRLVEFDSRGLQVRSYRVRGENDAAVKVMSAVPFLLSVENDSFSLLGWDGVIRNYKEIHQ